MDGQMTVINILMITHIQKREIQKKFLAFATALSETYDDIDLNQIDINAYHDGRDLLEPVRKLVEVTEHTVNSLLEGRTVFKPDEARKFLRNILTNHPAKINRIAAPIVCQLIRCKGWHTVVTENTIVEYVRQRLHICEMLRPLADESLRLDPECEYMIAMLTNLHDDLWNDSIKS
jgi:hypothetical protein